MQRRTFLRRTLLVSAAAAFPACARGGAKAEVLRSLVAQVVVPNTAAAAEDSRRLELELAHLATEPSLTTLHAAREQWQRALLSWKRADAFRNGPIMDTNCLLRVMFWPVRAAAIDALLQSSQTLDAASVDAMGVDRRGLFALEHVLYPASPDDQTVLAFSAPAGLRRAQFAQALAANVSLYAGKTVRTLGDGKAYGNTFADGGQDSINRLVGQLVYTVEHVFTTRLSRIADLGQRGLLKPSEVEGSASRMSQQIALTYLQAAQQLYLGVDHGLGQLVKAQSLAIDDALRSAFTQAINGVASLGAPLEQVAKSNPPALEAAAGSVKKLERALKTELASTLGVTMTFTALDGD